MREKRDFRLRKPGKTLTPERLMRILSNTAGEDVAKEKYKELTGHEPPVDHEDGDE